MQSSDHTCPSLMPGRLEFRICNLFVIYILNFGIYDPDLSA